jgi:hypothetical protein
LDSVYEVDRPELEIANFSRFRKLFKFDIYGYLLDTLKRRDRHSATLAAR